jgi:hypothetical protein
LRILFSKSNHHEEHEGHEEKQKTKAVIFVAFVVKKEYFGKPTFSSVMQLFPEEMGNE